MKEKTTRFITEFLKMEAAGGILLMLTAALAVISANISGLSSLYEALLHLYPFSWIPGIKAVGLNLSLHHIINDGLMAVFFFLGGSGIKAGNAGRRTFGQAEHYAAGDRGGGRNADPGTDLHGL